MIVLTYTSYKEHCDLYAKICGSIAVNSWQIELAQKDIILLSEVSIVIYKAGKHTRVENDKFVHLNISADTYSIDQRNDWEPPQIKYLKLVIPEDYTFRASNHFFIALGIPKDYLEKTMLIRSTGSPGSYKTSLDTSTPPISLSLQTNQQSQKRVGWTTINFVGRIFLQSI